MHICKHVYMCMHIWKNVWSGSCYGQIQPRVQNGELSHERLRVHLQFQVSLYCKQQDRYMCVCVSVCVCVCVNAQKKKKQWMCYSPSLWFRPLLTDCSDRHTRDSSCGLNCHFRWMLYNSVCKHTVPTRSHRQPSPSQVWSDLKAWWAPSLPACVCWMWSLLTCCWYKKKYLLILSCSSDDTTYQKHWN